MQHSSYQAMGLRRTEQSKSDSDDDDQSEPDYIMVDESQRTPRYAGPRRKGWVLGFNFQLPEFLGGAGSAQFMVDHAGLDARNLGHEAGQPGQEWHLAELRQHEEEMQDEMDEIDVEAADMARRKDELTTFWGARINELDGELEELRRRKKVLALTLHDLQTVHTERILPDPEWLHFVEHRCFVIFANLIIIANIVVMVLQVADKNYKQNYRSLDNCLNNTFMIWYVVELALRATLWRRQLLFGELSRVSWNWMDLSIVLSGVVELWLYPLMMAIGLVHGRGIVRYLRYLRVGRLLRVMKLVHTFMESDLSWAHGNTFQLVMMGVIALNCLIIGLECDLEDFWGWKIVEQVLLLIFSFEITVRLKQQGCSFFYDPMDWVWNYLDFIIVGGGVIDQWLIPCISFVHELLGDEQETHSGRVGKIMMMLRMARLLRILRLVRLIHSIGPLYQLITTIIVAMQGMCWVLLLTIVLLYIFALLAVRLVSHGLLFGGAAPPEVAAIFPTVPEAIFVLFQVMNGESSVLLPLFQIMPASQIVFMLFTVLSSWAILSILTAVVSENMIRSCEEHRQEVHDQETGKQEALSKEHLTSLYNEVDVDGDGFLTEEEYMSMMEDNRLRAELMQCTGMKEVDLREMFRHLSRNQGDEHDEAMISLKDFVEGLQNEHRPVSERSIMRLEKRLHDVENEVSKRMGKVLQKQETMMADSKKHLVPRKTNSGTFFSSFGSSE